MASEIASSVAAVTRRSGRSARRLVAQVAAVAGLLGAPAVAHADTSAADKATAEALFDHARSLMKEGKYAEACPKLAESQRLDAGLGTMLYLADCYDHNGQTASAWALFLEAASLAHTAGQADREKKARAHAAALEPKLSRLSISLAAGAEIPGIEVKRDGQPIGKALWGTAVPLDPGEHHIEASAPGKQPWSVTLQIGAQELSTRNVEVPALADVPKPATPAPPPVAPAPAAPPPGPPTAPAAAPPRPAPGPRAAPRPLPPIPEEPPTSSARVAGYSMIGIGLATAAVGGVLGAVALLDKTDSEAGCRVNNVCLPDAAASRSSAVTMATGSTGALIAGGTSFLVGMIIIIATRPAESIDRQVAVVAPRLSLGLGGASIGGSF
jgi:serine/threonine-protein kinase